MEEEEEIDELEDDEDLKIKQEVRAPVKSNSRRQRSRKKSITTSTSTSTSKEGVNSTCFNGKDNSNRVKSLKNKKEEEQDSINKSDNIMSSKKRRVETSIWIPEVGEDGESILQDSSNVNGSTKFNNLASTSAPQNSLPSLPSSIELPQSMRQSIETSGSSPRSDNNSEVDELDVTMSDLPQVINKNVNEEVVEMEVDSKIVQSNFTSHISKRDTSSSNNATVEPVLSRSTISKVSTPHISKSNQNDQSSITLSLTPVTTTSNEEQLLPSNISPSASAGASATIISNPIQPSPVSIPRPKPPTHQLIQLTPEGISSAISQYLTIQTKSTENLSNELELIEIKLKSKEKSNFTLLEKNRILEQKLSSLEFDLGMKEEESEGWKKRYEIYLEIRRGLTDQLEEKREIIERMKEEKEKWEKERDEMRGKLGLNVNEDDTIIDETDDEEE